jgi:IS30 family transposase
LHPRLATLVEQKLTAKWSPEQIAGWLAGTYVEDAELRVSHETIYRTLFVQSRGALKRELTQHLRTRRAVRRPKAHKSSKGEGRGQLVGTVHISQRLAEAEDRAVPGHWEGICCSARACRGSPPWWSERLGSRCSSSLTASDPNR